MKKKFPMHVIFKDENFDINNATSATDFTGLIPFKADSEQEFASYEQILNYSPKDANIYNSVSDKKHTDKL